MRRLEHTIGLSRGAIFHHFQDKDTLFFELAHEDAERMADVASREGLIQVMRDMLAAPEQFDWLATRLEIARKLRNDPAFQQGMVGAVGRTVRRRRPNGCATEAGRTAARRRAERRAAHLPGPGARRPGRAAGLGRRPRKAQRRTRPRRIVGPPAVASGGGCGGSVRRGCASWCRTRAACCVSNHTIDRLSQPASGCSHPPRRRVAGPQHLIARLVQFLHRHLPRCDVPTNTQRKDRPNQTDCWIRANIAPIARQANSMSSA